MPKRTAILVLDMQEYFLDPRSHAFVPSGNHVLENIRKILFCAKKQGMYSVYTYTAVSHTENWGAMGRWWRDKIYADTDAAKITPSLPKALADAVIRKTQYSAFFGTDLEPMLRTKGITNVVITGVMTHLCCDTTARDAFMRGLDVVLPIDATATYSRSLHRGSLEALAHGCAVVTTTEELCNLIDDAQCAMTQSL